jgi:hypothetical protein
MQRKASGAQNPRQYTKYDEGSSTAQHRDALEKRISRCIRKEAGRTVQSIPLLVDAHYSR